MGTGEWEMLSQEEIDALLRSLAEEGGPEAATTAASGPAGGTDPGPGQQAPRPGAGGAAEGAPAAGAPAPSGPGAGALVEAGTGDADASPGTAAGGAASGGDDAPTGEDAGSGGDAGRADAARGAGARASHGPPADAGGPGGGPAGGTGTAAGPGAGRPSHAAAAAAEPAATSWEAGAGEAAEAAFEPFSPAAGPGEAAAGLGGAGRSAAPRGTLDLLLDVPLQITVELGQTQRTVRELLEMAPGTVVELDRLAGEPVDLLVNGRLIARGEVVVIDENFGIRITDIVSPGERLRRLR